VIGVVGAVDDVARQWLEAGMPRDARSTSRVRVVADHLAHELRARLA
jgi:hypothetical protein